MAVRASFQVSFASLPAVTAAGGVDPARAFCLLGLWQGSSISSQAAAALFGAAEYLAADALEILVDTHLLESTEPDRYQFHDLLRVYASERAGSDLPGDVRAAAVRRVLGWYMRTADAAASAVAPHRYNIGLEDGEDDQPPLAFLAAKDAGERANLVAATRQAFAAGLRDIAWRLPAPLFAVFNTRQNWADCITTHRIALDGARAAEHRQGEAWILNNLGEALGITHDSEGIRFLEQALAIRHEIGDRMGEAQAANNLADAYRALGRLTEVLEMQRRALAVNRAVGYRFGEGIALVNLGDVLLNLSRADEAIDWLQQARRVFAEIEEADGTGYSLYWLGRCHASLGRDAAALEYGQQALASHRAAGNQQRQAITLSFLGQVQARNGLAADARESRFQAAAIFDDLGDTAQAAQVRAEQDASGIN